MENSCEGSEKSEIKKILIFLKKVIRIFNINFDTITERGENEYE